jgi:hypothetical protein
LVFSRGIATLAVLASIIIIIFQADVTKMIALYAIGVFMSFTLSQAGMAKRWWKSGHLEPGQVIVEPGSTVSYDKNWKLKLAINSFGSFCTLIVMFVFAVTKFKDGAWIIVVLIPTLVAIFFSIHHHYESLSKKLTLENYNSSVRVDHQRIIVLISGVHRGSLAALAYARSLGPDVTALHVSLDKNESEKVRAKWALYGEGVRLIILDSPYRLLLEPILDYVEKISAISRRNEMITIVVPQFVTKHWWENSLHNQTALMLRFALIFKPGCVITEVPYLV